MVAFVNSVSVMFDQINLFVDGNTQKFYLSISIYFISIYF